MLITTLYGAQGPEQTDRGHQCRGQRLIKQRETFCSRIVNQSVLSEDECGRGVAQSFSHFSHFASSPHKMACQSVVRLSDAEPSKSYGYAIMSRGGRSISCETFLSLRF